MQENDMSQYYTGTELGTLHRECTDGVKYIEKGEPRTYGDVTSVNGRMTVAAEIIAQDGTRVVRHPSDEIVGRIVKRCLANDGYCPCDPQLDADHRCPCRKLRESGKCCCGLYVQVEHETHISSRPQA